MASTNGITGDSLVNKPNSKEYEENYDKIFGKKKSRIDVIGQNGNDGITPVWKDCPACKGSGVVV